MKSICEKYIIIIVFIGIVFPSISSSADPFMGEGKQNYIDRCVSTAEVPGYSIAEKRKYCECFADKLEESYPKIMKTLENSGSLEKAQKVANEIAEKVAIECMNK